MVAAVAGACSDSTREDRDGVPADGGPGTGQPGEDAPIQPTRAEFGLDARPSNTTCLAPDRPPAASNVELEQVFAGVSVNRPMWMAQPPGDSSRWFVAQRNGMIVSFPTANPPATPPVVANVPQLSGKSVEEALEGGFFAFAFHPNFAQNGRIYVSFTTTGDAGGFGSEIGYIRSTDGGATFTSYSRVLHFQRDHLEHNGGGVAFGPDGLLYLSFGDARSDGALSQLKTGFHSKVLRIDVDNVPAGQTYGIPNSNPFKNGGGEPATFAWGLRNPYRLTIDSATGDVWVGDVGQSEREEINRVVLGGNYGWPCREGTIPYSTDPAKCPSTVGLIDPVAEHSHDGGPRAIIGGVVYRGKAIPGFQGTYVYGDLIRQELWALKDDPSSGEPTPILLNETGLQAGFTGFHEDAEGEIYVTELFQNKFYKLVAADQGQVSTFPDRLSKTGCVDPADPTKPAAGLIPFTVNAELWSDGADKERFLALPDGKTVTVEKNGHFDFPVGSVLVKSFSLGGKRVETRLFIRHEDGEWAGYTYEWNDEQTDAVLLPSGKSKKVGDQTWTFPSRSDCVRCHTAAAGRTLGPELGQLNGDHVYPSTNRIANQLKTLDHIGLFATPLGKDPAELPAYPSPHGEGPLEARARAYLHSNCAGCHQPDGGAARSPMDLRFGTPLADTSTCGVESELDDLDVPGARIVAPGAPAKSLLSLRVHATNGKRMPPLGRHLVDAEGVKVLDGWIRSVKTCP
jgi:uncharacterized repeat protein (TIGR03806 family)